VSLRVESDQLRGFLKPISPDCPLDHLHDMAQVALADLADNKTTGGGIDFVNFDSACVPQRLSLLGVHALACFRAVAAPPGAQRITAASTPTSPISSSFILAASREFIPSVRKFSSPRATGEQIQSESHARTLRRQGSSGRPFMGVEAASPPGVTKIRNRFFTSNPRISLVS